MCPSPRIISISRSYVCMCVSRERGDKLPETIGWILKFCIYIVRHVLDYTPFDKSTFKNVVLSLDKGDTDILRQGERG